MEDLNSPDAGEVGLARQIVQWERARNGEDVHINSVDVIEIN